MPNHLSKCCQASIKACGEPEFADSEIATMYCVCTKCGEPCDIYVPNDFIESELVTAESLLGKEKNLDQVSFLEGYIKGLKAGKQSLEEQRKEIGEEFRGWFETTTSELIEDAIKRITGVDVNE